MNAYEYDFSGSCANSFQFNTFSVGIFQWIPKSSRKGLKKSTVKVRVHGYTSNPEAVYKKAHEICEQFNGGVYVGPRELWVKAK